ncbi:MAG TPA: hypothetical protein VG938_09185 [Verrucomicrobiae bacterium]|jgi:hypothetical protein|nr:hypothetical protein [Verrucomicrobiae bacterium]
MKVDPVAALYELARRHPEVGKLHHKCPHAEILSEHICRPRFSQSDYDDEMLLRAHRYLSGAPPALAFLSSVGMSSWPNLTERARNKWRSHVRGMRGVESRGECEKSFSILERAALHLILERARPLKSESSGKSGAFGKLIQAVKRNLERNPLSAKEIESAVANEAIRCYREDHVLVSFASELPVKKAAILAGLKFSEHRKITGGKQRSKAANWLEVIASFESIHLKAERLKRDPFVCYRRAVDRISFSRHDILDYCHYILETQSRDWGTELAFHISF